MATAMNDLNITYVVYIATTTQKLWDAITSPDVLQKNWGRIQSEWKQGSKVTEADSSGKLLWQGEVRRCDPPHVLSYTFDVMGTGEPPTEVTFELGPPTSPVAQGAQVVRLLMRQVGFQENSKLAPECARAWPEILSSLKTYVETGRPLGFAWKH